MAAPWGGYLLDADFDEGVLDTTVFNGTTVDTQAKFVIRHYTYLIQQLRRELAYRGAYCVDLNLALGTADAYVESTLVATALAGTLWFRFMLCVEDLVMASLDAFSLLEVQSAGPVTEAMVGIRRTAAGNNEVYAGETHNAGTTVGSSLLPGWHCIELGLLLDSGGGNDGTLQLFVDGYQVGATITTLDQAAITQMRFGAMRLDAGTTSGMVLLDNLVAATYRVGGFPQRWPQTVVLTKSGHVAVGNGSYEDFYLMPGGPLDNHALLYDTDEANTVAELAFVGPDIANSAPYGLNGYIASHRDGNFHRGLYVKLSGTNPRAYIVLRDANLSNGAIRNYAWRRRSHAPY